MRPYGDFMEHLSKAINYDLSSRERDILYMWYGIDDSMAHTLEDIGKQHGVSRERIRQIVNKSVRRISNTGHSQLRLGKRNPCVDLIVYLRDVIVPLEPGDIGRIFDLVQISMPHLLYKRHAFQLILRLLRCYNEETSELYLNQIAERGDDFQASIRSGVIQHEREARQHDRAETRLNRFRKMLDDFIVWPSNPVSSHSLPITRRYREVPMYQGNASFFFSEKMKRDVQYESLLEMGFFLHLEQMDEVVHYQEQPFAIPYEGSGGGTIPYYPDVFFVFRDGKSVVAELKPPSQMALEGNLHKWTTLKHFCAENGYGLLVDCQHSFDTLLPGKGRQMRREQPIKCVLTSH